jgi:GTP cyclohydrolase I
VQERLTMQIVQELQIALGTEDVACVIDANTFVLIQEESSEQHGNLRIWWKI